MSTEVRRQGTEVVLMWVPAYVGILGNERVCELSKQAARKENIDAHICQGQREQESRGSHHLVKNRSYKT